VRELKNYRASGPGAADYAYTELPYQRRGSSAKELCMPLSEFWDCSRCIAIEELQIVPDYVNGAENMEFSACINDATEHAPFR
jgi:hypothetical protein